jgi:hypothetical protein
MHVVGMWLALEFTCTKVSARNLWIILLAVQENAVLRR